MPSALVLNIDRLASAYLGPYGNTWIETTAWNRLAASSTLMETAIADSYAIETLYRSYWHGQHALSVAMPTATPALPEWLGEQGVDTWLVTDDPEVAQLDGAQEFAHQLVLSPRSDAALAESLEHTQTARLFATALDALDQARDPFLIWVHAQAMDGIWDAPYALRCRVADPEDPSPPEFALPPEMQLSADYDPDQLLAVQQAYAGQVTLVDTCLNVLLDHVLHSESTDDLAVIGTSARGYPLGEHLGIGRTRQDLYAELIHVPWLMHWPMPDSHGIRDARPVQPPDLYPTLIEWSGCRLPNAPSWGASLVPDPTGLLSLNSDRAATVGDNQRAVRVNHWFLRELDGTAHQLFAKPDDRWEVNEVSGLCRSVVEQLTEVLANFQQAAQGADRSQLSPLPDACRS